MNIKESSLVAKIYKYFNIGTYLPESLCSLVWNIVLGLLLRLVLGLTISFLLFIMLAVFFTSDQALFKLGIMIWCLIGFLAFIFGCFALNSYLTDSNKKYILIEFIKAKYKRVCPRINWIKDEQSK